MSNWSPPARHPWMEQADCARPGVDPDWWFPAAHAWLDHAARAIAICNRCPVKRECLGHAMTEPHVADGIWGGMTGDEIRSLRRRARRQA